MARASTATVLTVACFIAPAAASNTAAQPAPAAPPVTVSVGAGPIATDYRTIDLPREVAGTTTLASLMDVPAALTGSLELPLSRWLLLDTEVTYAAGRHSPVTRTFEYVQHGRPTGFVADTAFAADESVSTVSLAANLLVRVDTAAPRVSTFFGGGTGIRRTATRLDTSLTCVTRVPSGCDGRPDLEGHERGTALDGMLEAVYGMDVIVGPRLAGFVTLKYPVDVFFDHDGNAVRGFHMTGGVRLAVLGRNWEKASLNGRGRGRVRTGTALGAVIGGVVSGVVAPMSKSDDARIAAPILLSAWGAGAGAAFGALLNLAR